jgi:hypothetical protein
MPPEDYPDPPGWEDPIVAEVRKAREEIRAEFSHDLYAYAAHLQALEKQARKRVCATPNAPLTQPHWTQPDAV